MDTLRLMPCIALTVSLLLIGCEGPMGPEGRPGPPGPAGPQGAIVSTFEVTFDVEAATEDESGLVLFQNYDFPEITNSVDNNGFVQAYYLASNDTWTAMPYTFGDESPDIDAVDYKMTFFYAWNVGLVQLFYEGSAPFALDFAADRTVKIVVADAQATAVRGVDWSDYNSVKHHFDLDE